MTAPSLDTTAVLRLAQEAREWSKEEAKVPWQRVGMGHLICAVPAMADAIEALAPEVERLRAEVAALKAENERLSDTMQKDMVPISDDGQYVFIDGPGDQAIDWQDKRLKRAETAEAERDEARRALAAAQASIAEFLPILERHLQRLLDIGPDIAGTTAYVVAKDRVDRAHAILQGTPFLTKAANDILEERRRQLLIEGWALEHDDAHCNGELALAAAAYAADDERIWPWTRQWWKPKNRRKDLVRAGALILAEIERLDRAALSPQPAPTQESKDG